MIRRLEKADLPKVMEIWLNENIKAHHFINECYWMNHVSMVQEMIAQAEVYVYEENQEVAGFIGIEDNYLAGIFVKHIYQSRGIGKELLNYVKSFKSQLSLHVYLKNESAVKFYEKADFKVESASVDEENQEREYLMVWKK